MRAKSGVAERSRRGAGAERVGEVDGAPVGGGSLGHEGEERRGAEHEERALRPDENWSRLPVVGVRREEARSSNESAQRNRDGDRAEVLHRIEAGCGGDRTEPGAGKAAEAEGRVERREDRPAAQPLEGNSLRVCGHVDRPEPGPEQEERGAERGKPAGYRGQEERSTSTEQRRERDGPAADPLGQPSGGRHREERAE